MEWKIEDGWLLIRDDKNSEWVCQGYKSADALTAAVAAERDRILGIIDEHSAWGRSFGAEEICERIAAAIRSPEGE